LTGFWEVDPEIVIRLWKSDFDLGSYQLVGRGQCADAGERLYGAWFSTYALADHCKAICDQAAGCVGIELVAAGGCVVRYDIEGLAEEPPSPYLTGFYEGDDAVGLVQGVRAPWDRICYMKPSMTVLREQSAADPYGGYWRMTLYARGGSWFHDNVPWKELAVTLAPQPSPGFTDCSSEQPIAARPPFVPDTSIWWGSRELRLWAGQSRQWPSWREVAATAPWDNGHILGAGRCPVAAGTNALPGKLLSVENAVWGLRDCHSGGFRRFSPDVVELSEAGWREVASYRFLFGVEVFMLRCADALGLAVVDYTCFGQLVQEMWSSIGDVAYASMLGALESSECTGRV